MLFVAGEFEGWGAETVVEGWVGMDGYEHELELELEFWWRVEYWLLVNQSIASLYIHHITSYP